MLEVSSPAIAVVVGLVLPYVLAVLNRPSIKSRVMAAITIVLCLVGAFGVVFVAGNGDVNQGDLLGTTTLILGVSQLFYVSIGRKLGLPELEAATSPLAEA
jgi:hypothetical protein